MSFNYTSLANSAASLLTKFGKQYTFTRTVKGAYSPATGRTSDTSSTFTGYGCLFDYSDADRADGAVLQGDRRLLAEAGTYEVGDKVAIGSDSWRVVAVADIAPSGAVVASNLQIRK